MGCMLSLTGLGVGSGGAEQRVEREPEFLSVFGCWREPTDEV